MNPIGPHASDVCRRTFLGRGLAGLGALALQSMLDPRIVQAAQAAAAGRVARRHQPAAPRREGQAGHLPLPGRRPVASRDVRLQAEARGDERRADARVVHQGTAARAAAAAEADVLRAAVRVQEVRQVRPGDGRDLPAHRQRRRRPVHRPLDVRRADQSRSRPPDHEHRVDSVPAGRASARGCSTAWARKRRTCPASS